MAECHREVVAGRGAVAAEMLLAWGTVAERHREAIAGLGRLSG